MDEREGAGKPKLREKSGGCGRNWKTEWDKAFWRRLFGYQCPKSKCTVEDEPSDGGVV
jgi:hypothetical protein